MIYRHLVNCSICKPFCSNECKIVSMIAFFYYLLEVCKVRFPIGMKVGPTVELNEGDKIVNEYSCAIRSRLAPEFLKLNFIECLIQLKFYLFRRNSSRRWHSSLLNWRTIMWCPLYTAPCRHRIALHYNKNDFSIFFCIHLYPPFRLCTCFCRRRALNALVLRYRLSFARSQTLIYLIYSIDRILILIEFTLVLFYSPPKCDFFCASPNILFIRLEIDKSKLRRTIPKQMIKQSRKREDEM